MKNLKVAAMLKLPESMLGSSIIEAVKAVAGGYTEEVSTLDMDEGQEAVRLVLPGQCSASPDEDLVVGAVSATDPFCAEPINSSAVYSEVVIVFQQHEGAKHLVGGWDNDANIMKRLRAFRTRMKAALVA